MRQKLLITTLFVIFNMVASAQKVEWKKNGLTWFDFNGSPNLNIQFQSELNYYLGYNTEKLKQNDTIIHRYKAYCYVESSTSWVNPNSRTDLLLKYNQVLFDIVELYKRKFQDAIDLISNPYEIEPQFKIYNQELNQRLYEYKNQSVYGNKEAIYWSETINKELELTPNSILPRYTRGTIGYGMHIGLGYGTPTSSLTNYFSGYPFLLFGFDFGIKKITIFINGTLGGGKVKKDYVEGQKLWKQGEHVGVAIIELTSGYSLIDNSKHKISPFAGFGITEFTSGRNDNPDPADNLRLVDYNLMYDINYDYKFKKVLKFVSNSYLTNFKEYVEASIRTRIYLTNANYYTDLKGMTINFSFGVCGFGRRIRTIND